MSADAVDVTSVQRLCFRSKRRDPLAGVQAVGILLRDDRMLDAWQRFFRSWQAASDALRTTFHEDGAGGRITAMLHSSGPDLVVHLAPARDVEEAKDRVARQLDDHEARLDRLPLSRHHTVPLDDGSWFVLVVSEHIIHDSGTVATTFAALAEITAGHDPLDLVAGALPYQAFASRERDLVEGPEAVERLAWWKSHLDGVRPIRLPRVGPRQQQVRGVLGRPRSAGWPPEGAGDDVTPFDLVSAALLVTLSPHLDDAPVVFNMPWDRRRGLDPGFRRTAGNMVEYLPLRLHLRPGMRFGDLVALVAEERRAARARVLPLAFLLDELGLPWEDDPTPLLQVMVNLVPSMAAPLLLQPRPKALPLADRVELHPAPPIGRTLERHDMGVVASLTREGLRWRLSMRHDLFAPALHNELDETFAAVVDRVLANMGTPVGELV